MKTLPLVALALALALGADVAAEAGSRIKKGGVAVRPDAKNGITSPRLVEKVEPVYPEACRAEKVAGTIILDATIDRAGNVVETRLIEGKDARLSAAALEAVRQWKYEPAHDSKGRPVTVLFTVTVMFRLD